MTKVYLALEHDRGVTSYSIINSKQDCVCGIVKKSKEDSLPIILTQFFLIRGNEKSTIYIDHNDREVFDLMSGFIIDNKQFMSDHSDSRTWRVFSDLFIHSLFEVELSSSKENELMRKYAKGLLIKSQLH